MQDWVKKILSPFKKTSSEEKSESGSFSSWENMNPDELSSETKPRSNLQKTLLNLGVLLAVFLVIMLLQYGVQKFLNVGAPQVAEAPTPEATPEVANAPAVEPTLPTLAAPVAESSAPEVTPEAAAAPAEASNAEPVVAQNYEPKFNETGEEELPILQEKIVEAAATPVVAQAYEPKLNEAGEEELPILQEKTPELVAPTTVAAESYTPQLDASGEEQLPILSEKTTDEQEATTVVVLNDQNANPAPSAPIAETPVATAAPEPTPAPVAEQPAATPAPVVESPAPVAAPTETAVASSTPVQAAPKRVNAAPAAPRQLHSPEWLAKQNAATQKLLAEKAKNPQKNKASVVVKSAHPALGEQVIMNTEQKRRVTEVPGFIPEENQAIASIGRE